MIRKIFSLILVILFFGISISFARFNYPHVLRKTFNDFDSAKVVKWVNVPIEPDSNTDTTISVDYYVKGVVYKELLAWAYDTTNNNKYIQGFAAQAIAARTYLANKIVTKDSRVTNVNDSTVQVPNGQGFQVFQYLEDYPDALDSALVLASNTILDYFDGDGKTLIPIDALYGGQFEEPFTRDSENCGLNYQPYLRSVENYEKISGGTSTSQKCGMSQIGALSYARENINFETILDHYYGPTPPVVTRVTILVVEGDTGAIVYDSQNDTTTETDTTREFTILADHWLKNFQKDLAIEVRFDEVVGSYFERTASADAIRVWLTNGTISKEFTENKEFWRIENLNKPTKNFWWAKIPKENLTDLTDGFYSIKVSASHFQGGYLLDSIPKDKAYKKNFETEHFLYDSGFDTLHVLKIDTTPPTVTIINPPPQCYINKLPVTFSARVIDSWSGIDTSSLRINIDGIEYSYVNGMNYDTLTGLLTFTTNSISEGLHKWHVQGRNNAK